MDTLVSKNSSEELVCWKVWGGNARTHTDLSIPGFEGALYSNPYRSTKGGDLYYMSACGSGAISRICLADVSGHGERMAPVSKWFEGAFSKQIHLENSSQVLKVVNEKAVSDSFSGFSTAICASYNSLNGELQYCYAGHPPIRICRNGNKQWEELKVPDQKSKNLSNLPLGVSQDSVYTIGKTKLYPGDRLALYTDGLVEAQNTSGQLLGNKVWEYPATSTTASGQLSELLNTVDGHIGSGNNLGDDVTIIVFDVKPYQRGNKYSLLLYNHLWRRMSKWKHRSIGPVT